MDPEMDLLDVVRDDDEDEADAVLDWDLHERDRYMAEHEDFEKDPDIEVLVGSDR